MQKQRVVFYNGEYIPESEARVSIYDSALMFGDMVFEMTRSFNKKQFKQREHLERLYASIKYMRIPLAMTIDEMEGHIQRTIEMNEPTFEPDDEHRLMIEVSRGLLPIYSGRVGVESGPTVIIADYPLRWTVSSLGHLFMSGINAVLTSQRAIPASLLEPKVKNRSRIHYQMANIEAAGHAGKDNWALLLDPDGFIAEGTGDNFFIVKDGTLLTPEPRNILRGISRQYVIEELAPKLGLEVRETNIEPYDVATADEAFMTATPFCILPVTRFNHDAIGDGTSGQVTGALIAAWSENVGVDIRKQIEEWSKEADAAPSPYEFKKA